MAALPIELDRARMPLATQITDHLWWRLAHLESGLKTELIRKSGRPRPLSVTQSISGCIDLNHEIADHTVQPRMTKD
jgi:hypothetical protein